MTKKKLPEDLTIGEAYGPAMKITEQDKADEYFEGLVQHSMRFENQSREEAEKIQRANLGYYAGYCSKETRVRVEKLFRCAPPIFGPISKGVPTAEEALEKGKQLAEGIKVKL